MTRRIAETLFTAGALLLATLGYAQAQDFPVRPIRLIVPFAAGGPADVVARSLAQTTKLRHPIVVDNRAGAGGLVGTQAVAQSPADGHTLLFVTASHAGLRALYPGKLGFDPERDFAPVVGVVRAPIVIAVNAKSKYQTLQDLVSDAKARPDTLNCAGGGGGATVPNLSFEALKRELGVKINAVPYRGSAPAVNALLAGEIDCDSDNVSALLPHIRAGTLRALAIATEKRSTLLPGVPTVAETVLPRFSAFAWFGVLAPKGTPQAALDALQKDFSDSMGLAPFRDRIVQLGMEPLDANARQFGEFMSAEMLRWEALITALAIKPQ